MNNPTVRTLMQLLRKYDPDTPVLIDGIYAHPQCKHLRVLLWCEKRVGRNALQSGPCHICAPDHE